MWFYRPNPPPAHFVGNESFVSAWQEVDQSIKPAPQRRHELELAALLLVDLRYSGPDWPTERYQLLADLHQTLRT